MFIITELLNTNFDINNSTWVPVGDVEEGRKNLGQYMPVFVYRLFESTIRSELTKRYGKEVAADIFREAGKSSGFEIANSILDLNLSANEFLGHFGEVLEENRMGILRIEEYNQVSGDIRLTISEDLDCSGLPVTGETLCNYDEGLLSGVLEQYTKKEYDVVEIDCWATGARVCRFEGSVKD